MKMRGELEIRTRTKTGTLRGLGFTRILGCDNKGFSQIAQARERQSY
jgi:hypothetical protein